MRSRAFSLVEILAVIAIITILVAVSVPAFKSLERAQSLTSGAASVIDELAFARQTALARNRIVEVRLYKRPLNPGPVTATNPEQFRSFRTVIYDDQAQNFVPLGKLHHLPRGVVMTDKQEFSTLIYPYATPGPGRAYRKDTPAGAEELEYQCIRFKPAGETDLDRAGTPDGDKWFLTFKLEKDPEINQKPAMNYVTVMLNPVSGKVRAYRP